MLHIRTSALGTRSIVAAFSFASTFASAGAATTPAISVSDVWSRPSAVTAVVYAKIRNTSASPDRLIGAASPVATHVGIHESSTAGTADPGLSMGGMPMPSSGSMTSMKPVASIAVPPKGTLRLEPGGYHLMLDLRRPIRAGETFALRLHFARAGWIGVRSSVRSNR